MLLAALAEDRERLPSPQSFLQLFDLVVDLLEQLFVPGDSLLA
jgi:hypothetical protein